MDWPKQGGGFSRYSAGNAAARQLQQHWSHNSSGGGGAFPWGDQLQGYDDYRQSAEAPRPPSAGFTSYVSPRRVNGGEWEQEQPAAAPVPPPLPAVLEEPAVSLALALALGIDHNDPDLESDYTAQPSTWEEQQQRRREHFVEAGPWPPRHASAECGERSGDGDEEDFYSFRANKRQRKPAAKSLDFNAPTAVLSAANGNGPDPDKRARAAVSHERPACVGQPKTSANGRSTRNLLSTLLANDPSLADSNDLHMDQCNVCTVGGDLVCCDGCTAAYHLKCAALRAVPIGDWMCSLCVAEGVSLPGDPAPGNQRLDGGGVWGGREQMPGGESKRSGRTGRPTNNKGLFDGQRGGLQDGERLHYNVRGRFTLSGTAVVGPAGGNSGVLCDCCSEVISCSVFQTHAGHSGPCYENIFTDDGRDLKTMAAELNRARVEAEAARMAMAFAPVLAVADTVGGGEGEGEACVRCQGVIFERGNWDNSSAVVVCTQCERKVHYGCLGFAEQASSEAGVFCTDACRQVNTLVSALWAAGDQAPTRHFAG